MLRAPYAFETVGTFAHSHAPARTCPRLLTQSAARVAAIASQATCVEVGGAFTPALCDLETGPLCNAARGMWTARKQFSLTNGMVSFSFFFCPH